MQRDFRLQNRNQNEVINDINNNDPSQHPSSSSQVDTNDTKKGFLNLNARKVAIFSTIIPSIILGVKSNDEDESNNYIPTCPPVIDCPSLLFNETVKIGVIIPGFQYDFYFAGLMLKAANRSMERMKLLYDEDDNDDMSHFKIEYVICETCTYDPSTIEDGVQEMYDDGIRLFVGPLTSSQCETLGDWSVSNAPDTLFISPSATSNVLNSYGNIIRMIMDNTVRVRAYASKFSEFTNSVNESVNIVYLAKNDVSSTEFFDLLNETADSYMLNMKEPIFYDDDSLESKVDAKPVVGNLSLALTGLSPNNTVVVLQSHDEITYILEAANDYPEVLSFDWMIVGMAFNQDLINSAESVENSMKVNLASILYVGNGYSFLESKKEFLDDLWEDMSDLYPTKEGILNPLTLSVHDSVMLMTSAARMYGDETTKENIFSIADSEFGFTGFLKMNEDQSFRYSGQYVYVGVQNVTGVTNWVVLEELFSSPIVDTVSSYIDFEYTLNEQDRGIVCFDKLYFDDSFFCDVMSVEIEGVDKFGNFKTKELDTGELTKIKENGLILSLKNDHNFLKVQCSGVNMNGLTNFYYWIVCASSFGGNFPICTINFFDQTYEKLEYYHFSMKTISLRDTILDYKIEFDDWIQHSLGFFISDPVGEVEENFDISVNRIERVINRFRNE